MREKLQKTSHAESVLRRLSGCGPERADPFRSRGDKGPAALVERFPCGVPVWGQAMSGRAPGGCPAGTCCTYLHYDNAATLACSAPTRCSRCRSLASLRQKLRPRLLRQLHEWDFKSSSLLRPSLAGPPRQPRLSKPRSTVSHHRCAHSFCTTVVEV